MLLEIKGLSVHYGSVEAVGNVSLEMKAGEFIALLGANGAGKSTVLKTISALRKPTSGEIWFAGQRIDEKKSPSTIVRMGISHVPEGRQLFPDMTVEDNLVMGAYVRKDIYGIRKDIRTLYNNFPILRARRRQRAGSMSGGEQQIVAICRALMAKPRLLLMDEPSIGLSPIMVDEVGSIITSINKQGISIMLVEQNVAVALDMAERAYVMENGKIVISGDCDALLNDVKVKEAYLGV